jgi:hypothetical protein
MVEQVLEVYEDYHESQLAMQDELMHAQNKEIVTNQALQNLEDQAYKSE